MDLKEATNVPTSVQTNVKPRSEKNDTNNRRVYDILFPGTEDVADQNIDESGFKKYDGNPVFGSVSTLDWLATWRPLEIS